jgi:hypothetical protein
VAQVALGDVLAAADALGDVVAGELDVDAARVRAEARCTSKKPATSSSTSSKYLVLLAAGRLDRVAVHRVAHPTTGVPLAATASASGGSACRIRPAPIRVIRVRRPGSSSGSRALISASTSWAATAGPILTATGLRICRANSTWAPPGSRVRSPIHSRCPDEAYACPLRASVRVRARS